MYKTKIIFSLKIIKFQKSIQKKFYLNTFIYIYIYNENLQLMID